MSKGDNRRPSSVSKEEYDKNFEALFGKKKLNIWTTSAEEGDLCPNCPGGRVFIDPHWPDRLLCNKCNSNWAREKEGKDEQEECNEEQVDGQETPPRVDPEAAGGSTPDPEG